MNKLVAFLLGVGLIGAAFAGVALALVLGGLAAAALFVARIARRLRPGSVSRAETAGRTGFRKAASRDDYRIWNDGRGTIIDM